MSNARLLHTNRAAAASAVLSASSEDAGGPRAWLKDEGRSLRWRSKLGWNIVKGFNDEILVSEETARKVGFIAPGNYPTGAGCATAVAAAMNAGGVDPASLASIKAWFKADSLLPTLADGAVLTQWSDSSGQGNHLSAVTGSPTLTRAVANGRAAVYFNGSSYLYRSNVDWAALLGANGVGTAFVVFSPSGVVGTQSLWSQGAPMKRGQFCNGSSLISRFNDGTNDDASKGTLTAGAWHIGCWVYDGGANGQGFLNDQDTAAAATVATGAQASLTSDTLLVGSSGSLFTGYIAEILIFSNALNEEWRRRVTKYLRDKYAISESTTAPAWANTYAASYSASKFTLSRSAGAATMGLPWTATSFPNGPGIDLGFDTAADDTGGTTYLADNVAYKSREWLKVDLGSALAVQAGVVIEHNLGTGGTITQQGHTVDGWTAPDVSDVLAGDATIRLAYRASASKRWWRLLINDVSNPAGYTEIGIWYVGPYAEPSVNYSVNFTKTPAQLSSVTRAINGAVTRDARPTYWIYEMSWLEVPEADRAKLAAWVEACPGGAPFFLAFDPTNAPTDVVYGMFVAGTPQQMSGNLYWTTPLTVEERL